MKDRKDRAYDFLFGKFRDVFFAAKHLLFILHAMRETEVLEFCDRIGIDRDKAGLQIRDDRRNIPAESRHIQDRSQVLHPYSAHQGLAVIDENVQSEAFKSRMKAGRILLEVTHDDRDIAVTHVFKLHGVFDAGRDILEFIGDLMEDFYFQRKIKIFSDHAGSVRIVGRKNRKRRISFSGRTCFFRRFEREFLKDRADRLLAEVADVVAHILRSVRTGDTGQSDRRGHGCELCNNVIFLGSEVSCLPEA